LAQRAEPQSVLDIGNQIRDLVSGANGLALKMAWAFAEDRHMLRGSSQILLVQPSFVEGEHVLEDALKYRWGEVEAELLAV
jgi:hypothetical protein